VGVPTGKVDMLAFGLGSGIAGLGGVALSQIGNVGPDWGRAISWTASWWWCWAGGPAGRHRDRGHGPGHRQDSGTVAGAVLAKILILGFIILFIQKRPQGLLPSRAGY
jgi:urea transport system permease protein